MAIELLYIIARHRADAGLLGGGVVGTVMSNLGLEQALAASGHSTSCGRRWATAT